MIYYVTAFGTSGSRIILCIHSAGICAIKTTKMNGTVGKRREGIKRKNRLGETTWCFRDLEVLWS